MLAAAACLSACASLPASGPSTGDITARGTNVIRVINVDESVVRQLHERRRYSLFSDVFPTATANGQIVHPGDIVEVYVWEAPPTVLFSSGIPLENLNRDSSGASSSGTSSNVTSVPAQMVDVGGNIYVPFAGELAVAGKSLSEIEAAIARQLRDKANRPQVLVRLAANNTAYVTVVGEVTNSIRMPLTPRGERLLDALAAAGGTKAPVEKVTLQLTRNTTVDSLPLATVIRDPRQNVQLQPGDVVTALYQPLSFTALGATGRNDEVNFEAIGISLSQALARAGALLDARSSAQGVFIFRLESPVAADAGEAAGTIPGGQIPVIYRVDLTDPRSFFLAQNFPMENRDVLYVANAPTAQLQKFLNLVVSTIYPIQGAVTLTK